MRLAAVGLEVVEEGGEPRAAVDLAVGDRRPQPATADEEALVDHLLDGPTDGGPGETEPSGEGDLVLEGVAGLEPAVVDRGGQLLGELVVQGYRGLALDDDVELHR